MNKKLIISLILISLIAIAFANTNQKDQNFSVYIDYEYGDLNYIKEQITNVNYVRYKNEADVFILFTKQRTGSNGKKFTIDFTGQNIFSGIDESLSFILKNDDVNMINMPIIGIIDSASSMSKEIIVLIEKGRSYLFLL